jgi:hypothetical protein
VTGTVLVAVAVTGLAGCGGAGDLADQGSGGAPPTTTTGHAGGSSGGRSSAVDWVNGFCGASTDFVKASLHLPDFSAAGHDLHKLKSSFGSYLSNVSDGLSSGIDDLDNLGPAPDPAGDAAAKKFKSTYSKLQKKVGKAKLTLAAADPDDPEQFSNKFEKVEKQLSSFKDATPGKGLQGSPEMARAAQKAPKCQQLESLSSGGPSSAAPGH